MEGPAEERRADGWREPVPARLDPLPAPDAAAQAKVARARTLRDAAGADVMQLRAATDLLIEAADAFDLAAQPVEFAGLHLDLADILARRARLGDPDVLHEAIDSYQRAIVVFNRDEFPEAHTRAFHGLGLAHWTGGQLEAARWCFERVAEALPPADAPVQHAQARASVGAVLAAMPDPRARAEALAEYQAALRLVDADTRPAEHAELLLAYGQARRVQLEGSRLEQLRAAVDAFERAAELAAAAGRPDEAAAARAEAALTQVELTGLDPTQFERAGAAFDLALRDIPADAPPDRRAELQLGYARLWAGRLPGGGAAARAAALERYEAAIALAPRMALPARVAAALIEAPRLLLDEAAPPAARAARALELSRLALAAWPRAQFPTEFARVQHSLGAALLASTAGDRAARLRQAVDAFEAGLDAVDRSNEPEGYAELHLALADALAQRRDGDRADNLRRAGASARRALEAVADGPLAGRAHHTLGRLTLEAGGASAADLQEGAAHLRAALAARDRRRDAAAHAETQLLLGMTLATLAAAGQPQALPQAIQAYRACVAASDRAARPLEFASAHNNLASALLQSAGAGAQDVSDAVRSYETAAEVFDAAAYPQQHAMIRGNLAQARARLRAFA